MFNILILVVILGNFCSNVSSNKYNITNVLMIIVDDLRPEISVYLDTNDAYFPDIQTPNIDALAAESIVFKRAYTQYALCGPSRSSFMTGRRPDTTGVYRNSYYWRESGGNFSTIPQYFKENGYDTFASGKIFHSYNQDDEYSWTENNYGPTTEIFWHRDDLSWGIAEPEIYDAIPLPCMQIKDYAIQKLRNISLQQKPFFMAVGFEKPHSPFLAPREFFELYPEEDINLAENLHVPYNHPEEAWSYWNELPFYDDISMYDNSFNQTLPEFKALELRRAYYASVSYTDSLIGELLQEVNDLGLNDNTAVLFISDHGYSLGENSEWGKDTNFFLDTHIPMMLKIPSVTDQSVVSDALVEVVDIFPTLVDVAGLPEVEVCPVDSSEIKVCHEGKSVTELISEPDKVWKSATFSQALSEANRESMGYSIHTTEYNYIRWVLYINETMDWDDVLAEELFDSISDPNELINVAGFPEYEEIQIELADRLYAGWRDALP